MESSDQEGHPRVKRLLLATDFSAASEAALPYALKIAHQYEAKLYIAHVIWMEIMDLLSPGSASTVRQEARQFAQRNKDHLLKIASQAGVACQSLIGEGVIWEVLESMIRGNSIDLIIMGTHGRRGPRKLLLGSVAEEVFRLAPCPVLTVGPKNVAMQSRDIELSHILYPVKFIPDDSPAAAYAVSLADEYHARLTFTKIFGERIPSSEMQAVAEEPVRHWMDDHIPLGSDLRTRTCFQPGFGSAGEAILKLAGDLDVNLIVMNVQRLDPVMAAHIPAPDTAYEVVQNARCPVLTVR